jgi:hypothetical protein
MSTVYFIGLLCVLVLVTRFLIRHRASLISARGFGVGADIGRLHDVPRVRVRTLTAMGDHRAQLVVVAAPGEEPEPVNDPLEVTFVVELDANDRSYAQLREWLDGQTDLGIVVPEDTRIIRLRSIVDMQPLTLRLLEA